eukprot:12645585-Ditylum_brightwellii.AAC.1
MWSVPITAEIPSARLTKEDKAMKGFKMSYCGGDHLWQWINRIFTLSEIKIVWDGSCDDPNGTIFILSIDCKDLRT